MTDREIIASALFDYVRRMNGQVNRLKEGLPQSEDPKSLQDILNRTTAIADRAAELYAEYKAN